MHTKETYVRVPQVRLTGSKLETAPTMATSTTPPDTTLSRKFLSDGVSVTASATSGVTSAVATPADTLALLGCSRGWNDDAAGGAVVAPFQDSFLR
jgi:hypothetical protein